jgi:hypothetical protein
MEKLRIEIQGGGRFSALVLTATRAHPASPLFLPGAKLPLVESFGLLSDIFPFPIILDAGYLVFDLH